MLRLLWRLWRLTKREPKARSVLISMLQFYDIYYEILVRSIERLDDVQQRRAFSEMNIGGK